MGDIVSLNGGGRNGGRVLRRGYAIGIGRAPSGVPEEVCVWVGGASDGSHLGSSMREAAKGPAFRTVMSARPQWRVD